jgi:hypothetical protein
VKHSSGKTDIEFENMDFLELTSSEEILLFEAVSNVSSDVPIVQSEPTPTELELFPVPRENNFGILPGYTLNNCFIT